jgi:hypothetical protein
VKISWLKGLTEEERVELEQLFSASLVVRKKLTEILEGKVRSADRRSVSIESYESPSWVYTQADTNGYIRALREVITLIE